MGALNPERSRHPDEMLSIEEILTQPTTVNLKVVRLPIQINGAETVSLCPDGTRCVDGRYDDEEAKKGPSFFGGDAGALMAVMTVVLRNNPDLSVEKAIGIAQAVLKAYQDAGLIFHIHTDSHAQEEDGIGCGHIGVIVDTLQQEGKAEIAETLARVYNYLLKEAQNEGYPVEVSVLEGDHQEKAVIVINDASQTLPRNVQVLTLKEYKETVQAFVNNPEAAKQVLMFQAAAVYEHLRNSGLLSGLTANEFFKLVWVEYTKQANATTQVLAGDLQVFSL